MKEFLGTKKIQRDGRIVLDATALKSANLHVGREIEIHFDTDSSVIIVEGPKQVDASAARWEATKGG